ncbi:MAG: response regulator transcription factor [Geopsychrobacter sp.]|nr:response regulator transcription factor [Geopsychrobacter sp.]
MSEAQTLLVVEDEEDILALLHFNLIKAGYQVECATCGEEALAVATEKRPALILLDLMLPGIDGLEICRRLRAAPTTKEIPIIMLTACGEEADIVKGLELGADDYVTKPYSTKVLLARIQTVLRHRAKGQPANEKEELIRGDLSIHPGRNLVQVKGENVELTFTEFKVLESLAGRPGWVFTRQQIIDTIRGYDYLITPRAVDVQIFGLRKKLGPAGACIETVRGIGYRMKET